MVKSLPVEFTVKGFKHTQVERNGNITIYERRAGRRGPGLPAHSRSHFEVVRIHTRKANERFGQQYPATEHYPRPESWGTDAFTCVTLDEARTRAATLSRPARQNA